MFIADNTDFQNGLIGGLILGISSSAFIVLTGKITGLSGIADGMIRVGGEDWNWTYMAGLSASGIILSFVKPDSFGDFSVDTTSLILAGILTGFGTRLASGCTSGHGLCGLSRRSPRSLVAVLSFMFTGGLTAYLTRALNIKFNILPNISIPSFVFPIVVGGVALKAVSSIVASATSNDDKHKGSAVSTHIAALGSGLLFGLGLGVSGMCSPTRVIGFLDFTNNSVGWDPTLMSVLGAGVTVTFITFHYFKAAKTPVILHKNLHLDTVLKMGLVKENLVIDWKLIIGSLLFGVGWGLAGMCPGPAIVSVGGSVSASGLFVPSMMLGMKIKEWLV